jgi:cytochrome c
MALVDRALLGVAVAACLGGLTACEAPAPAPAGQASAPAVLQSPVAQAAGFDPGPVRTAAQYLAQPEFASADPERGRLLSLACAACHTFGPGQGTLVGPNLHGVFGRHAGTVAGFDYSPALAASGLVWTPVSLEAWLTEPMTFVAGTKMAFTGYRSPADRLDLIAYLLRATD